MSLASIAGVVTAEGLEVGARTFGNDALRAAGATQSFGMMRYLTALTGYEMLKSYTDFASTSINSIYNNDYNAFEKSGEKLGAAGGETAMFGLTIMQSLRDHSRKGMTEVYKRGGTSYKFGERGHIMRKAPGAAEYSIASVKGSSRFEAMSKVIKKSPKMLEGRGRLGRGIFGASKMLSNWKWDLGITAGVILGGFALEKAGGFIGSLIDDARATQNTFRRPYYDTRYFDTSDYNRSSYEQLGSAMENYHKKMVSVARIMHRG